MKAADKPNPLLEAALAYAARGWPVFPCNNKNKRPLVGKDRDSSGAAIAKSGGVTKATCDAEQIRAWWEKWPMAMIGVAMGHNGLFALDFDPRTEEEIEESTGEVIGTREFTLEQMKAETEAQIGAPLPATLAVRTPSGGVHLYFRQPIDGGEPIHNRGNLPKHVDVRGVGGYVIAPPSFMEDGRQYRWLRGADYLTPELAPTELIRILREPKARPTKTPPATPAPASSSSSSRPPAPAGDAEAEAVRRFGFNVLDKELQAVRTAGSGDRQDQLNKSAFTIAGLVAAGAIDESIARSSLEAAAAANPGRDDDSQLRATIDSGWSSGIGQPIDLAEVKAEARDRAARRGRSRSSRSSSLRPNGPASSQGGATRGFAADQGPGGGEDGEEEADLLRRCAFYPQTDLGNLERFLARHGRDFLFVEQWGWLAWDGQRWNRDMAVPLLGHAVQCTMRGIQEEAKFIRESGIRDPEQGGFDRASIEAQQRELFRGAGQAEGGLDYVVDIKQGRVIMFSDRLAGWGRTSESAGHLRCIPGLAEAQRSARTDDFDADPLLVNLENGTLEFFRPEGGEAARGRRREHRREDLITKLAEVSFDPSADCPKFDVFLEEVQPDLEMRDFLDAWGGYNMLGLADAQKMAVFHGQGSNGKGVWIQTVAHILGDYAWAAAIETFIDQGRYRKGSDASPDLAALAGRRMVYANEPEENAKFSDGLIKAMTSDEPIGGVRELMKPPFELQVTFTNTVSANHRPRIGTDHGIQRRMQLIPWDVVIPDDRADPQLKSKLKAEASGILNRLIRGALAYLNGGLPQPEAVKAATREYLEENDILGQFLALCLEPAPGHQVGATAFHRTFAAWQAWANQLPQSGKAWSAKHLNGQMQRKGFKIQKSSTMQWQDIALRYEESDFVDHEGKPLTGELAAPRSVAPAGPSSSSDAGAFIPGAKGPDDDVPF